MAKSLLLIALLGGAASQLEFSKVTSIENGIGKNWFAITMSGAAETIVAAVNREASAPFGGHLWTSTDSGASFTMDLSVAGLKSWMALGTSLSGGFVAAAEIGDMVGDDGYTGGGIYLSDDFGATFRISSAPMKYWHGLDMSSTGDMIAAVVRYGRIWLSTDRGDSWTVTGPTRDWTSIAMSADGTKMSACEMGNHTDKYHLVGGYIYRSTDSGATWAMDESVGEPKEWWDITMSADGTKQAAIVDMGNIWTSSDSGVTWIENTSIDDTDYWQAIAMSRDGEKVVAAVSDGLIWMSSDAGTTFKKQTSSPEYWYGIAMTADGTKVVACDNGPGYIWLSWTPGQTTPPTPGPTKKKSDGAFAAGPAVVAVVAALAIALSF